MHSTIIHAIFMVILFNCQSFAECHTDSNLQLDQIENGRAFCTGLVIPGIEVPTGRGETLCNHDGTFENAYAWGYSGVASPDFGAFAESFSAPAAPLAVGITLYLTQIGFYTTGSQIDLYCWENDGGRPGNTIAFFPGYDPGPPAEWPGVSEHSIPFPEPVSIPTLFWVGYWGNWVGESPKIFITADLDGPGSIRGPQTRIQEGLDYPSGWQDPSIVWDPTQALGICVQALPTASVGETPALKSATWGGVKSLYK